MKLRPRLHVQIKIFLTKNMFRSHYHLEYSSAYTIQYLKHCNSSALRLKFSEIFRRTLFKVLILNEEKNRSNKFPVSSLMFYGLLQYVFKNSISFERVSLDGSKCELK